MLEYLDNYPDKLAARKIYNGFKYGFPLHYEGPLISFNAENLKSAKDNPSIVQEKIQKEIQSGRVEGPFSDPPFNAFRVSPLGLVPKKEPGEYRMIHHLSYPKGNSVNDFIDQDLCSVQYTKFDAVIQMVQQLGQGALLAKTDIKSAFRLLPVSKTDFQLLGFSFEGFYYFDKALPFGCSISCATFEMFANFIQWVIRSGSTVGKVEHYLDDFLFGGARDTDQCSVIMKNFFSLCEKFGIPLSDERTEGPTTVLVFLGLEIDSVLMQVRIPISKIHIMVTQIEEVLGHKRSITLKELQSLLGSLNFMCRAIVPGRPFCRRLINATCGITSPHHHIKLSKGMRQDLKMWLCFFQDFNGISFFNDEKWLSNWDFSLYTDSSAAKDKGFGIYFQGHWSCASWPQSWIEQGRLKDITLLEYFPILVAIYIWGDQLTNRKVLFRCDNLAVIQVLNQQTTKASDLMVLVRALTLKCLKLNVVLRAEHIPGCYNVIADSLSRLQIARFRRLAPEADEHPVPIPSHLWNIFSLEPESF